MGVLEVVENTAEEPFIQVKSDKIWMHQFGWFSNFVLPEFLMLCPFIVDFHENNHFKNEFVK